MTPEERARALYSHWVAKKPDTNPWGDIDLIEKIADVIQDAEARGYRAAQEARPPIPADVWQQMVERGARAAINPLAYDTMTPDLQAGQRRQFARGLRAALGISDE